jgi:Ca-activated chloride channel family protein
VSPALLVHPEWATALLWVWLVTLGAVALSRLRARRQRRRLAPGLRPGVGLARDGALLLALACIGAALLGPRLGDRRVRVPASGIDLVLLLDVSRSMEARDVPPSRLARARGAAEQLLARLGPGDRAALAAFAGRGVLLTPLTPDRDALAELLSVLEAGLIQPGGSDLGAGVRAALDGFEAGSQRPRVLFVLSDGEDPEYRGEAGASQAARRGVRVLAAALGTESGALLGERGAPLLDQEGTPVVSRRRAERLERLAAATDGALFRGDAWGAFDLDAAAAAVRRDAGDASGEPVTRRVRAVRVLPLAALAFTLLAGEGLAHRRRSTRRARTDRPATAHLGPVGPPPGPSWREPGPRGASPAGIAWLLPALLVAGALLADASSPEPGSPLHQLEESLRARPGDARLLVELGLARLARGHHAAAERALLAAAISAGDPSLAALAYYDLGVSALERGDPAAARDAFFDALALEPASREARFNLEWSLQALEQRPATPDPPPPPPEPRSTPPPSPRPAPEEGAAPESSPSPAARPLDDEQRRRWLDRVRDDPSRALRAWAGGEQPPAHRSRRPTW